MPFTRSIDRRELDQKAGGKNDPQKVPPSIESQANRHADSRMLLLRSFGQDYKDQDRKTGLSY